MEPGGGQSDHGRNRVFATVNELEAGALSRLRDLVHAVEGPELINDVMMRGQTSRVRRQRR